jgi:phosphoribosylformylglycinamidine cyclo-ligase
VTDDLTYKKAGVDYDQQDQIMHNLTYWVTRTFDFQPNSVKLPLGYFANVVDIGNGLGLALSTDGVGTKIIVAQMMNKYDTVGIDCVAMNVNDVLCVGAKPIALLDYIAVEAPHPDLMGPLIKGLYEGAAIAKVTIPGGEIAQVGEMIRGVRENCAFDLVGTCAGIVSIDKILMGERTNDGDIIVGLRSTGIHSNGLSLARKVFFDRMKWPVDKYVNDLGRTIGEELLEPTRIYVREVLAMLERKLNIKALAHITSSGFMNLSRANSDVRYVLDNLPEPQPIFRLIQDCGGITADEMFFSYNMGIGFCIVVAPEDAASVLAVATEHGVEAQVIGHSERSEKREVLLPKHHLTGFEGKFHRA